VTGTQVRGTGVIFNLQVQNNSEISAEINYFLKQLGLPIFDVNIKIGMF
jgi:hypothetical protein